MTSWIINEGLFITHQDDFGEMLGWVQEDRIWWLDNSVDFYHCAEEEGAPMKQGEFTKKSFHLPIEFWNNEETEYV